jgi:arginase family enzyme
MHDAGPSAVEALGCSAPHVATPDAAAVGVPCDAETSDRPEARSGPQAIRIGSKLPRE